MMNRRGGNWLWGGEHRVIITDPDNNNKMVDVYQPRKTYRIYRAQD